MCGDVYSCSPDAEKVLVRTCGDFDGDGYLEWDDIKVFKSCGDLACVNGACVNKVAELSLSFIL